MEASEYLKQPAKIAVEIECLEIERQQWLDLAMRVTACTDGERVQSSRKKSPMQDAADEAMECEKEIAREVKRLAVVKTEVSSTLRKVQNPTWYKVLHMIYFRGMELQDVADAFGKSYDWAKSAHSKAKKIVQRILDEK